jgi:acyl-CoA synthetase (AMP-forming)/AMP-acid ligase II
MRVMPNPNEDVQLAALACGMAAGSVRDLLALRSCSDAERTAFSSADDHRRLTYGDLAGLAARWEAALAAGGLPEQGRVGLCMEEPLDFVAVYLSCLAAGLTVVPLNPGAPLEEMERTARRLRLDLLLTDRAERPAATRVRQVTAGRPPGPTRGPSFRRWRGTCRGQVLLLTSGSTGEPKLVPLREWDLLHRAQLVAAHHRLGPDERGYSPLPVFHINAQVTGILATLVAGSTLVIERRFRRTGFWERMEAERITWINAVPAILAILAAGPSPAAQTARRVRFARSASAPLPAAVLERFQDRCRVSVLETYGMTEAAGQITANPLEAERRRPGSAGLPVGVSVRVVDPDGRQLPTGASGSVEIRGPGIVDHYLAPSATPLRDADLRLQARNGQGWLPTGDLGHLDPDGFLFLTGRADDVINCGGEKVYPREVEEVLRADARVAEAVLVAQVDPVLGQSPVAVVARAEGVDPGRLASDLLLVCSSRLSRAKRPRRLIVVDQLPAGSTGKVSRRLVERQLTAQSGLALEAPALVS